MSDQDSTRMGAQESLQGGRRRRWLIPAGLFALIVGVMFAFALSLQFVVPVIGILIVLVCYAAMLVVAATVRNTRTRNRTFAWIMGAMAAGSLGCAIALMLQESA